MINPQWPLVPAPREQANGHQRRRPWSETAGFARDRVTYYDRPMLKRPTWHWYIPAYFYLGGIAGGAAAIGAAAEFLGGPKHRSTVRHARYLSTALAPACAVLLIADLGRPTRFHHMLRVLKVSSPMSVGTWILSGFGAVTGLLALRQAAEDGFILRRNSTPGRLARMLPAKPLTAAHGLLGLGLGGYTGTLLASTAVPLWFEGGELMGPLFLSTAMSSGAAALRLMGRVTGEITTEGREDIEDVENVATIAELGLVMAREVLAPAEVSKPLREGLWGNVFKFGAVGAGMVGSLALSLVSRFASPRTREILSTVSACLSLAGAAAERFAITEAGKASATDPLAYQAITKGAPGEARPTPAEQAQRAPRHAWEHPYQHEQVTPDVPFWQEHPQGVTAAGS
jgi:formate-dependent nitrite reductase membrane component NrfD